MESARFMCLGGQGLQWEAGKQDKVCGKTQVRIRLCQTPGLKGCVWDRLVLP